MILKKSKTKWIDISELGIENLNKIMIDYPTGSQGDKLLEILFQIHYNNPNNDKTSEENLTVEQKAKQQYLIGELANLRIKFCVKDWESITYEDGSKVDCKLVNSEIDNNLFDMIVKAIPYNLRLRLSRMIADEIELSEADKKK